MKIELVRFQYDSEPLLNGVFFACDRNEKAALCGLNRSGKTTLFKLMLGTLKSDIRVVDEDGVPVKRDRFAYLPQDSFLPKRMTLVQCAKLMLNKEERVKLNFDFAEHMEKIKAAKLSKGWVRFFEVMMILRMDREFVLLDEPFSGLDPLHIEALKKIIQNDARCMVISDHYVRDLLDVTKSRW